MGKKHTTLNLREKEQSMSAEATLRWSLEPSFTATLPQQSALLFLQAHVEASTSLSVHSSPRLLSVSCLGLDGCIHAWIVSFSEAEVVLYYCYQHLAYTKSEYIFVKIEWETQTKKEESRRMPEHGRI